MGEGWIENVCAILHNGAYTTYPIFEVDQLFQLLCLVKLVQ